MSNSNGRIYLEIKISYTIGHTHSRIYKCWGTSRCHTSIKHTLKLQLSSSTIKLSKLTISISFQNGGSQRWQSSFSSSLGWSILWALVSIKTVRRNLLLANNPWVWSGDFPYHNFILFRGLLFCQSFTDWCWPEMHVLERSILLYFSRLILL